MRKYQIQEYTENFDAFVISEKDAPYTFEEFDKIVRAEWNHLSKFDQDKRLKAGGYYSCESYEVDEEGWPVDDSLDVSFSISFDELKEA